MYVKLLVGDKVSLNIAEIYRSMLPTKTKEMLNEIYNRVFTVKRIDEETGYIYLDEIPNIPLNNTELIRVGTKKLSEIFKWNK